MPFIFHSKKQSIFDRKILESEQQNNQYLSGIPDQFEQNFKVNVKICKQHPFRKFQPQKQLEINLQGKEDYLKQKNINNTSKLVIKNSYSPVFKNGDQSKKNNNVENLIGTQQNKENQGKQLLKFFLESTYNLGRIRQQQAKILQKQSSPLIQPFDKTQQRLKFITSETPGPGSYQIKTLNKQISAIIFSDKMTNHPLPKKKQPIMESNLFTKQNEKYTNFIEENFLEDCSYKNQNSSVFKQSILDKHKLKKNKQLLSMLLSQKNCQKRTIDNETACSSINSQTSSNIQFQQCYQKVQEKSPSPFTYNVNNMRKPEKIQKVFINGASKFTDNQSSPNFKPRYIYSECYEKKQSFNQNLKKTTIGPWKQENEIKNQLGFDSSVARQLHFDNEQLCKHQLYYTPKNNMIDEIQRKGKKMAKNLFGSCQQRFLKQTIQNADPYKYCYSRNKFPNKSLNCASLKYTAKRQLFGKLPHFVSPQKYDNKLQTISKQIQNQLFKKLLKEKYQDEIGFLKEKKKSMQRVLIEQKMKNIDIRTSEQVYEDLRPQKYKQFLSKQKSKQKHNISFGNHKYSVLKRGIQPIKQLDRYYQTDPQWSINSFNKFYGYELEQS